MWIGTLIIYKSSNPRVNVGLVLSLCVAHTHEPNYCLLGKVRIDKFNVETLHLAQGEEGLFPNEIDWADIITPGDKQTN